jgi:acyl-CoA synthetase (AMP-forming)/AMP-acid ligase II
MSTPKAPPTLRAIVERQAARCDGRSWLSDARTARTITSAGLADHCARWATLLAGAPAGPVALCGHDPVGVAVALVSIIAAGREVAPLDPAAPDDVQRPLLEQIRPAVVVTDRPLPTDVHHFPLDLPHPLDPSPTPILSLSQEGSGGILLFSSGTTGPRKLIRLSERALLHTARCAATALELTPADRGYSPLPLHHINAEVVAVLGTLVSGSTLVIDAEFHRTGWWELVRDRGVTWLNLVPAMIAIVSLDAERVAGVRCARSASAPLPVAVRDRFEAGTGIPIIETYGMTEAASQITANRLDRPRKPGSVGRPLGVDLQIRREGRPAPAGRVGRVWIRGPGVIHGYADEAGADRFDADGWLDTGDLGHQDADGDVFLAGRDSDVINRGGEKIFPREVEEVLLGDPAVRDALVLGQDDEVLGQVPVALVTLAHPTDAHGPIAETTVRQLSARCERALPRYCRPVRITLVNALPVGPTGKVSRKLAAAIC